MSTVFMSTGIIPTPYCTLRFSSTVFRSKRIRSTRFKSTVKLSTGIGSAIWKSKILVEFAIWMTNVKWFLK